VYYTRVIKYARRFDIELEAFCSDQLIEHIKQYYGTDDLQEVCVSAEDYEEYVERNKRKPNTFGVPF
jgi:hypothetical protein